jgi:4-amino-4-deoxy-L-arabinose transferase-like glycosyltransferase
MQARIIEAVSRTQRREVVVAGALAFAIFFVGVGDVPVIGRDEARFTQAAREMSERGDLVVPSFAGEGRFHKPILIYWCTMASYAVFGVNERAARLPSNLAGALSVMLLAWSARRRYGPGAGLLAAVLMVATVGFHAEARGCTADMVMLLPTLAVMLALEGLLQGDGGRRAALVFWIGSGLAILAKGPVAPVWVLCTGIALWALGRRWRPWEIGMAVVLFLLGAWRFGPAPLIVPAAIAGWSAFRTADGRAVVGRLGFAWGVPLLLAMTLPWVVAVNIATDGAFLRVALGEHLLDRSMSSLEGHGFIPGFYPLTAVLVAFPWFALLVEAIGGRGRRAFEDAELRYLVAWLVGPLIMLELVQTKLVHYWMPSYPAGVLLVVGWALAARKSGRVVGVPARALVVVGALTLAVVPPGVALYLGISGLLGPGLLASSMLAAAVVAGVLVMGRQAVPGLILAAAASILFLVTLVALYLPRFGAELLAPRTARRAIELRRPEERIVVFKPRDDDLYFYLPLDAATCRGAGCLDRRFRAGESVLGISRERDFELLIDEWPGVRLLAVERVDGIDVGHLRPDTLVLFRPLPRDPMPGVLTPVGDAG